MCDFIEKVSRVHTMRRGRAGNARRGISGS
jgi:hypothetical protein